jgi:hypothetical protein
MSDIIIRNFNVRFEFMTWKGTYNGRVVRGKALGHGVFTAEGEHAGYRLEGVWDNGDMRCGELKTQGGRRYVGEFARRGVSFRGRGELWLNDGVRLFDGEWEQHGVFGLVGGLGYTRRGMAVDSDGAVHRVEFEGERGAHWSVMERAFDEKQAFRDYGCTGASWSQLLVRLSSLTLRQTGDYCDIATVARANRSVTISWACNADK